MTAGQAALASGFCIGIALGIVAYAWATREPIVADEPKTAAYDGAWLTPEQLDDADRAMMIDEARTREDAKVARLDAIPVPGEWDVPAAWRDLWKAQS